MTGLINTENGTVAVDHDVDTVMLVVTTSEEQALLAMEPAKAAALAKALMAEAQNAIHAERLGRRPRVASGCLSVFRLSSGLGFELECIDRVIRDLGNLFKHLRSVARLGHNERKAGS